MWPCVNLNKELSFISTLKLGYTHEALVVYVSACSMCVCGMWRAGALQILTWNIHIIFCKQLVLVLPHISSCCFLLCCSQNYHRFTSSRSNSYPGFHLFALQVSQHDSFGLPLLISAECVSSRQRRPPGDPGSTRLSAWLEPLWRRQLLKAHSRGAAQQGLCEISREWVQLGRGGLRFRGRLRALMCHCLLFFSPCVKREASRLQWKSYNGAQLLSRYGQCSVSQLHCYFVQIWYQFTHLFRKHPTKSLLVLLPFLFHSLYKFYFAV